MKMIKNLTLILVLLVICDIITTIIGLNIGLVEMNVITLQFLNIFGIYGGLIISSILKLSMIGIFFLFMKFNKIVPANIMNIYISILIAIPIITTFQAVLNNITLIINT